MWQQWQWCLFWCPNHPTKKEYHRTQPLLEYTSSLLLVPLLVGLRNHKFYPLIHLPTSSPRSNEIYCCFYFHLLSVPSICQHLSAPASLILTTACFRNNNVNTLALIQPHIICFQPLIPDPEFNLYAHLGKALRVTEKQEPVSPILLFGFCLLHLTCEIYS